MAGDRESALIARHFAPLATDPGAWGLKDDAAVLTPGPGESLVATTDALVAGVHFLPDDPADSIAMKALRVNLSDLAAKTASPAGYLLTLALPRDWTEAWLASFSAGLAADQTRYGLSLLGGDTVRTPGPLMVSVTAFGRLPPGATAPRRTGARPGDAVMVTGPIGFGALGLLVALGDPRMAGFAEDARLRLLERYRVPEPPVGRLDAVRRRITAAMDVSDGLLGDLGRLCAASDVGAELAVEAVPLPAIGPIDEALTLVAVTGGDDYETLFTCAPDDVPAIARHAEALGAPVHRIGTIVAGSGVRATLGGRRLPAEAIGAYSHV